ncbi:MAG: DMT family transporter [Chloroflexota bacterium]
MKNKLPSIDAKIRSDDKTIQGILYLVLGLSVFSVQDVIMKIFSDEIALQEVIFMRGLVTLAVICFLIIRQEDGQGFTTKRLFLCIVRGAAGFTCFTTFSMALATLPLADAMPLYYTSPLYVIVLAIPILGETVKLRSWFAILVGFVGILLVAQPNVSGIEPAMILALISALTYSIQSLLARKLGSTESALGMTFYSMMTFVALSGFMGLAFGNGWLDNFAHPSAQYLFRAWSVPTARQFGLIFTVGIVAAIGFLCISQAYRLGEASVIAPFEYSSLPFAVFWGWLFWNEVPGLMTILGSILIIGSGLYVLRRESQTEAAHCT